MNILVVGASGFIASWITTDLLKAGHSVICCVRNVTYAKNIFPDCKIIKCDFLTDDYTEVWIPKLQDIDIVINCVGIFYHPNKKIIWQIHYKTPKALFDAALTVGIKKIIHISALNVEQYKVVYAQSKKAAEEYLMQLNIPSLIIQPSLVYGPGSYGGSSLFRGLASLPKIVPLPGNGNQQFQPIHVNDLSRAILNLIDHPPNEQKLILAAVSQNKISLKEILLTLRKWLGFSEGKLLAIPLTFLKLPAIIGNLFPYSSINTMAIKMLSQNNIASIAATKKFIDAIGFIPRSFATGIYNHPSSVQDRWHAKLYFLKPLLRLSLAFIWIASTFTSIWMSEKSYQLLNDIHIPDFWQPFLLYGASSINFLIGLALLINYRVQSICLLQIFIIIIYTLLISFFAPTFWLEPFGPIVKNIPILIAIMMLYVMEPDR